jgi:hypothetical protein
MADCNCTCQIAGAHDPDCAVYGPPAEPGDLVMVNRQDLRDLLMWIALWVPPDFRPSIILDRLVAATDTATVTNRQEER